MIIAMPLQRHDDDTKRKAVELANEVGNAEAARQLNLSAGTIASWRSRLGVASLQREKTRAAVEARSLSRADRIGKLAETLLDEAEKEIKRLREPRREHRATGNGDLVSWTEPEPAPQDRRAIATTVGILIDKSQLLAGEATSRTEALTADAARARATDLRDELAERRRRREGLAS